MIGYLAGSQFIANTLGVQIDVSGNILGPDNSILKLVNCYDGNFSQIPNQ